jgi:hypothetical protein
MDAPPPPMLIILCLRSGSGRPVDPDPDSDPDPQHCSKVVFSDTIFDFGLPRFVLSRFLFRGMVRYGIPTVCFYICSTERNSELFSLPLKGSEGNSESMLLFLFPRKVVFSSTEGFGTEFRGFLFCGTAGIPSEITVCSVYSVFWGIIFLSEIPNPIAD